MIELNPWLVLLVFTASAVADVAWAQWTLNANKHKPLSAALWGVIIILLGAVNVGAYISSLWYVIPTAAGAFIGTYATVYREKKKFKD